MPALLGRSKGFPMGSAEWDSKNKVVHRTYDDQVEILADSDAQGPFTIIASLAIPVGFPFWDDPYARAVRVGPAKKSEVNRLIWTVPIHYTTQFAEIDADDAVKIPSNRRAKRRWSYETVEIPFTTDAIDADTPVVNSAEEPFEDMKGFVIPVLTVERFEIGFDENTILTYADRTNENTFFGAPPKTVLCAGIEADDADDDANEIYQGQIYQRARYVFKFKLPITDDNKGWVARYIDAGSRYKDGDAYKPYLSDSDPTVGKRERIVGPLDGAGGKLAVGAPLVTLQFNKHVAVDFNQLQFIFV